MLTPDEHRLMGLASDRSDQRDPRPMMAPHTAVCLCGARFSADSYEEARLEWYMHAVVGDFT